MEIYLNATELCNSETENNILLFPVFITLTQPKLSLSDENRERKSSQTLKIVWVPHNSQTQSYDSKQPNPNRALFTPDYWLPKSISSLSFQEHHGLASYGPSTLFGISFFPLSSSTLDAKSGGTSLSVEKTGEALKSPNSVFSAGFYSVGDHAFCFAIWFSNSRTIVWMANHE